MTSTNDDITELLNQSKSDAAAAERVYELIYRDLKGLAASQLRGHRDATLSATALINEAYLKLVASTSHAWADRSHFLRVAARAMRQISIDHARAGSRLKRGGGQALSTLNPDIVMGSQKPEILLALEEGLVSLRDTEPRWVDVVELRFFAGLSAQEAADTLGISLSSVNRDWSAARVWLRQFLTE